MSKVKSQLSTVNSGFTLIELLIVIVILGILAVAILSAINPVEQIRKAQDAGKKSDSAELLNAVERYYTTFECYPWENATGTCAGTATNPTSEVPDGKAWFEGGATTHSLVDMAEVKPEFVTRANFEADGTDNVTISENTTTDLIHVCFKPESETFKAQANKDAAGGATGTTHICVPE